jgi:predicted peptidase
MDIDGTSTYIDTENSTEVRSHYTQAVEELIDSYAEKVGAKKILLCGCSNGGFMTLWLTIHRPDAYVGAVPICEAVPDALITDEQIQSLKDVPLYFVYSKDDPIVIPEEHEIPTIKRLQDSGKGDDTLHVSTTDTVVDTSGEVKDAEGNPYQYNGHWSWIYFDNNDCECDIDGLKAWDFIKECFA